MIHSREQLLHLVPEFTVLPAETEWLEFKVNNTDPEMIGERVSALANSARIAGREFGYLIWGVEDGSHKIVGTDFEPAVARKGNEPLEAWLARMVHPQVHFEFETVQVKSTRLVVLTIEPASFEPVKFGATAYVRVGPTTRELSKHPDRERHLWRAFDQRGWEGGTAKERLSEDSIVTLLDYPAYFHLLGQPLPDNRSGIIDALSSDDLISRMAGTGWRVTNLGAILLARKLADFPSLARKALRVIRYAGTDRLTATQEQIGGKGYAAPEVLTTADTMRVTLLSPRPLTDMTPDERAQAVYLHSCLNQVSRKHTTNSSVRQRFSIEERNKATASRLLKDAVSRELIVPYDKNASPRHMRYIPFWAAGPVIHDPGKLTAS